MNDINILKDLGLTINERSTKKNTELKNSAYLAMNNSIAPSSD